MDHRIRLAGLIAASALAAGWVHGVAAQEVIRQTDVEESRADHTADVECGGE